MYINIYIYTEMSLKEFLTTMQNKLKNKPPPVYNSECKEFIKTFDKKVRDIISKNIEEYPSPSYALFKLPIPVTCGPDVEKFLYKEGLTLHSFPGHRIDHAKEIIITFNTPEPFIIYME